MAYKKKICKLDLNGSGSELEFNLNAESFRFVDATSKFFLDVDRGLHVVVGIDVIQFLEDYFFDPVVSVADIENLTDLEFQKSYNFSVSKYLLRQLGTAEMILKYKLSDEFVKTLPDELLQIKSVSVVILVERN